MLISELVIEKIKVINAAFFVQLLQQVALTPIFAGDPFAFLILKNVHFPKGPLVRGALFGLYYVDF